MRHPSFRAAVALTTALTTAAFAPLAGAQTSYQLKMYKQGLTVSEDPAAALELSAGSIDFGDVAANSVETRQVRVSNPGTRPLTFTASPAVNGAAEFAAAGTTCGTTLSPGADCFAEVTFSPTASGTFNGTLIFTSTLAGSPHEVSLVGTAFNPVTLASAALPAARAGASYSFDFKQLLGVSSEVTPEKSQATWSGSGHLPAGLSLSPSTGVLSGTPKGAFSNSTLTVTATYKGNSAQQSYILSAEGPRSCKEHLASNPGAPSGWYSFDADGSGPAEAQSYYCDMTSSGGGWTRIVRQFESTPVTTWTGGVNGDSYVLSAQVIPEHTQVAFGKDEAATAIDYVDWTYTTGDIPKQWVYSAVNHARYYVHRSGTRWFNSHDPQGGQNDKPGDSGVTWVDTLTFTRSSFEPYQQPVGWQITDYVYGWTFSAKAENQQYRGFRMGSSLLHLGLESYAWTVWVR